MRLSLRDNIKEFEIINKLILSYNVVFSCKQGTFE